MQKVLLSNFREHQGSGGPVLDEIVALEPPRNGQQDDCCQSRPPKGDLVWVEIDCLAEGADESIQKGRNMDLDKRTRTACHFYHSYL